MVSSTTVKWNELAYDRESGKLRVCKTWHTIHPRFWKGFQKITEVNRTIFNLFTPEEVLARLASPQSSVTSSVIIYTEGGSVLAPAANPIPQQLVSLVDRLTTSFLSGGGVASGYKLPSRSYKAMELSISYDGLFAGINAVACIETPMGFLPCRVAGGVAIVQEVAKIELQEKTYSSLAARYKTAKRTIATLNEIRQVMRSLEKLGHGDGFKAYCQEPFAMYGISENSFQEQKLARLPSLVTVADLLDYMARVCNKSHLTRYNLSQLAGGILSRQYDMEGCDTDDVKDLLHGLKKGRKS